MFKKVRIEKVKNNEKYTTNSNKNLFRNYYTLYQIITYLKKQLIMLNCWQKDKNVDSEFHQLLFYEKCP